MSDRHTKLGFDQLLEQLQEAPEAIAANLSLAGVDRTMIGVLLNHDRPQLLDLTPRTMRSE